MEGKTESSPRRNHVASSLAALVGLILLYFLSVGPVLLLIQKTHFYQARQFTDTVYAPIIWLDRHTWLQVSMKHYLDFWMTL